MGDGCSAKSSTAIDAGLAWLNALFVWSCCGTNLNLLCRLPVASNPPHELDDDPRSTTIITMDPAKLAKLQAQAAANRIGAFCLCEIPVSLVHAERGVGLARGAERTHVDGTDACACIARW